MRRGAAALLCLLAVAVATGCGDGDEQSGSDAAQSYVDARNDGDAAKVCDLYSDQLKQQLAVSDCEAFVEEQTSGAKTATFQLDGVQESDDHATATITTTGPESAKGSGQVQIQLERQDGDWQITGLG
jgi:phage I-like protein